MYKTITMTLLCFFGLLGHSQEKWNLKKCIEYGLTHHVNNTIYANEKLAADARAREALAEYLPSVSLTSTLDNNLKLQQTVIPAGIFGPDERRISLTQKFSSNATAQLDQVIFDQSLLTGLKANKYNKQQAELNQQQGQETIIYNISTAYFQLFVYHQQLELLAYNKVTYEKQLGIYRLQVSKGTVLQKDLDKVTVDYNNTLSQQHLVESNLQLAENQLKFEMGHPINEPIAIAAYTDMKVPPTLIGNTENFSPTTRIDYQLSDLNIKLLQIEETRIRSQALPKLSGYLRYGAVGFGNNLNGAYDELLPFSAVGLKLSFPILDFFKRNAQYKQASIRRINAQQTLQLALGRYKVEYHNAYTKVLQAQTNMQNDQRNVTLAESVLKVTDLQFQKGTTNLTDWLNTQNSLKEAQNSYLNSLYSYYQARIDLEKATGTLKTFYNSL